MRQLRDERYTVRDYRAWNDGERWELIDGVPYNMSPAPRLRHQRIVGQINALLQAHLANSRCEAFVAPVDVFFSDDENDDTVVQPDILVVCDPSKLREHGVVGAPDFIVEILSPSTAGRDLCEKRGLYEREGVAEYWVVSPEEKAVFQHTLTEGAYVVRKAASAGISSARLKGFTMDLEALFAAMEGVPGE